MKKLFIIFTFIVSANLIFAGNSPVKDSPIAILMKTVKDVSFKRGDANWVPAKVGATLITSDEIKTGEQSIALVKFTDNSVIRVRENSSLKIYADKNKQAISKNTYVEKGTVGFNVSKQENEEFKFTTPTMVASIRGTEGFIGVLSDTSSILVVTQGLVNVLASLGLQQTGSVGAGQFAVASSNGTITISNLTPQLQNQANSIKKTTLKSITIRTNLFNMKIEYLVED